MQMDNTGNRKRKCLWAAAILLTILCGFAAVNISTTGGGRCTSPKNACINNLRQIDGAKEQWALETKKSDGDLIVPSEVDAYIKGGSPKCPAGGTYRYGKLGDNPACTIKGHSL